MKGGGGVGEGDYCVAGGWWRWREERRGGAVGECGMGVKQAVLGAFWALRGVGRKYQLLGRRLFALKNFLAVSEVRGLKVGKEIKLPVRIRGDGDGEEKVISHGGGGRDVRTNRLYYI